MITTRKKKKVNTFFVGLLTKSQCQYFRMKQLPNEHVSESRLYVRTIFSRDNTARHETLREKRGMPSEKGTMKVIKVERRAMSGLDNKAKDINYGQTICLWLMLRSRD